MAKRGSRKSKTSKGRNPRQVLKRFFRFAVRGCLILAALGLVVVFAGRYVNPWTTPYMILESRNHDGVQYAWVDLEDMAPAMPRSAVAAEDANFCNHWGFDMEAIRDAIEDGGTRGASTISQQTVKNLYLWHGRNYTRKAAEALLTPVLEAFWPKQRIIEDALAALQRETREENPPHSQCRTSISCAPFCSNSPVDLVRSACQSLK